MHKALSRARDQKKGKEKGSKDFAILAILLHRHSIQAVEALPSIAEAEALL
jgi:hypothetical protein